MKTSIVAFFGLASIFTGAFSAPTAEAVPAKHARDPTDIISSLYSTVQAYTATINATTASIHSNSSAAEIATAEAHIKTAIANINCCCICILPDISGALNNVIAQFGLTITLSFLGPLVTSLSGLLASREVVVNNLLAVVQALLDGLLTGLSLGLAGLTL